MSKCSCGVPRQPATDSYVGAFRYPSTYGSLFNCKGCGSTYLVVQWEEADDDIASDADVSGLLDDDEPVMSGFRDNRKTEAA